MIKNIERLEQYYYPSDLSKNRVTGVSAIMRIKNEEESIVPSILSVKNFFDEIICILNKCTDKTEELLRLLNLPNVKIVQYPFDIVPAGPDTKDICVHSINNIVYYTNYCISLSKYEWIYRFDADTIALPVFFELKNIIKCDRYNSVEERHWDLVGKKCDQLGSQEMTSFEKRLIRIGDNVKYILTPNQYAEMAYVPGPSYRVEEPTFVHLKHCKKDPQHQWNNKTRDMDHFKDIMNRHKPIKNFEKTLPDILKLYLNLNKNSYLLIDLYNKGSI